MAPHTEERAKPDQRTGLSILAGKGSNSRFLHNLTLPVLLLVALVNGLFWSAVLPFDAGNDETLHFEIAQFIATEGRLPVFGPDKDVFMVFNELNRPRSSYALHPSLAYIVAAAVIKLVPTYSEVDVLHAARLPTVIAGVIVVYLAYLLAKLLFKADDFLRLAFPVFVAFHPQFTFVSSYMNNDGFAIAATSFVVYLTTRQILRPGINNVTHTLLLGMAIGLVLLSKFNAYFVIPFAVSGQVWSLRKQPGQMICGLVTVGFLAVSIAGWWFARNAMLYDGDLLGKGAEQLAWHAADPSWKPFIERGYTIPELAYISFFWWYYSFATFWAAFGRAYNLVGPDRVFYVGFVSITAASIVGLWHLAHRGWKNRNLFAASPRPLFFLGAALFTAGLSLLSFVNSFWNEFQPQGRYLFPALLPICAVVIAGLVHFRIDRWRPQWLVLASTLYLVGVNLTGPFMYILPGYYAAETPIVGTLIAAAEGNAWFFPLPVLALLSALLVTGTAFLVWSLVTTFQRSARTQPCGQTTLPPASA